MLAEFVESSVDMAMMEKIKEKALSFLLKEE